MAALPTEYGKSPPHHLLPQAQTTFAISSLLLFDTLLLSFMEFKTIILNIHPTDEKGLLGHNYQIHPVKSRSDFQNA